MLFFLNRISNFRIYALLISFSFSISAPAAEFPNDAITAPDIVIITNESVTSEVIDQKTLRAIFSKQIRQWPDGQNVNVFVLDTEQHGQFCESYLGILPYVLERYWSRLTFSGRGTRPVSVDNLADMLTMVAQTPGAIGYIPEDQLNENVSILQLQ